MAQTSVYVYDGTELPVSDAMKEDFHRDGFIIVRNLLCQKELAILEEAFQGQDALTAYAYGNDDGDGRQAKMCLWNHPGNDVTGALTRTRKLAHTAEELLGAEVYHNHSKPIMKEARTGGKFVWHQDYGYWYNFACMFSDMLTVFIAMDPCSPDNGCLQVLRGSHRAGRIDHGGVGNQVGADLGRVAELEKCLDKVYVPLEAGDAMFFHCNLLHTSSANNSERRRWALLTAYNCNHNSPYTASVYGPYQPLTVLNNDAVTSLGVDRNLEGKDIIVRDHDGRIKSYFS